MPNVMRSNGLRRLSLSIALGFRVVSLSLLASAADDGKDAAIFRDIFPSYAKPITIVIIPAIFGEFIDHFPFLEVVSNQDRAFAKEWAKAIADQPTEDEVFDLETSAPFKHSMSDIIQASSVGDTKGKAVARLTGEDTRRFFGLESFQ